MAKKKIKALHSREPWYFSHGYIQAAAPEKGEAKLVCDMSWICHPDGIGQANAKRIVDCVNAMEGIEDPIEFMEKFHAVEHVKDWMNKKSKNSQS